MATAGNNSRRTGSSEPVVTRELLTDLWFTLAAISALVHLHLAVLAIRGFVGGEVALIEPLLYLASVVALAGLLVAIETEVLDETEVYLAGMGVVVLLLFAYVDYHALGLVAPALGIDGATAGGSTVSLLLESLRGNLLAAGSKLAELGLLVVFGALYLDASGIASIFGEGSAKGRNKRAYTDGGIRATLEEHAIPRAARRAQQRPITDLAPEHPEETTHRPPGPEHHDAPGQQAVPDAQSDGAAGEDGAGLTPAMFEQQSSQDRGGPTGDPVVDERAQQVSVDRTANESRAAAGHSRAAGTGAAGGGAAGHSRAAGRGAVGGGASGQSRAAGTGTAGGGAAGHSRAAGRDAAGVGAAGRAPSPGRGAPAGDARAAGAAGVAGVAGAAGAAGTASAAGAAAPVHQQVGAHGAPGSHQAGAPPQHAVDRDRSFLTDFELPQPKSWGLLVMRLSLAYVFIVFGFIKVWPASPAAAVVEQTIFFLPHPHFFIALGLFETVIGLLLLYKPTIRIASWLFFFQMSGTMKGLIFFHEAAWYQFPVLPTDVGTYIIKNFVFLGAAMVLVIGYTGSDVREPPYDKLKIPWVKEAARKFHWFLETWIARHCLTFTRSIVVLLLVVFGIKAMVGIGEALGNITIALNTMGIPLTNAAVFFLMGGLKVMAGLLLISNDRDLMTYSVVFMGAYIAIGLIPIFVTPQNAFYQGWIWIAPDFPTLWFLKDTVTLGAIWVLRDVDHDWDPTKVLEVTRDATQVALAWLGVDAAESAADSSDSN